MTATSWADTNKNKKIFDITWRSLYYKILNSEDNILPTDFFLSQIALRRQLFDEISRRSTTDELISYNISYHWVYFKLLKIKQKQFKKIVFKIEKWNKHILIYRWYFNKRLKSGSVNITTKKEYYCNYLSHIQMELYDRPRFNWTIGDDVEPRSCCWTRAMFASSWARPARNAVSSSVEMLSKDATVPTESVSDMTETGDLARKSWMADSSGRTELNMVENSTSIPGESSTRSELELLSWTFCFLVSSFQFCLLDSRT